MFELLSEQNAVPCLGEDAVHRHIFIPVWQLRRPLGVAPVPLPVAVNVQQFLLIGRLVCAHNTPKAPVIWSDGLEFIHTGDMKAARASVARPAFVLAVCRFPARLVVYIVVI